MSHFREVVEYTIGRLFGSDLILKNGVPMTLSEIVTKLTELEELKKEALKKNE